MTGKFVAAALLSTALMTGVASAQSTTTTPAPANNSMNNNSMSQSSATQASMNASGMWRSSKLIGLDVYNQKNEKLGDINEVILDRSGKIDKVVIGVGGFLGMGEHDIAVNFDKLKFVNEPIRSTSAANTTGTDRPATTTGAATSSANTPAATGTMANNAAARRDAANNWVPDHAMLDADKDQLKAMPQFKY